MKLGTAYFHAGLFSREVRNRESYQKGADILRGAVSSLHVAKIEKRHLEQRYHSSVNSDSEVTPKDYFQQEESFHFQRTQIVHQPDMSEQYTSHIFPS